MSLTGKFQYKCRLCGEIYTNPCTSENNARMMLISITMGIKQLPPGMIGGSMPLLIEVHPTCKAGLGLMDLQGVIFVDD